MTFDVTIGDADKLIIEDYLAKTNDGISKVAHHSMVNMIVNDYADAAAFKEAMEEYRKNPVTYKFSDVMAEYESA